MAEAGREAVAETFLPGPRELPPRPIAQQRPLPARIAMAHGAYLLVFGGWPFFHLRSFEALTGPKLEGWLAKGNGATLANIGVTLLYSGLRGEVRRPTRLLGAGIAFTYAALDFHYAGLRRRISPRYLVNGLVQLAFGAAWLSAEIRDRLRARRAPEPAFA